MTERYQTIEVLREGDVVTVSLNRPEVHNAFNARLIEEMTRAFLELGSDDAIRVVVLRGNGRSFCAGADVSWMRESLDLSEDENVADAIRMLGMFGAIDECPKAVVGRIHGAALGGGMGLIAVCDIVVAEEQTRFGFTEARLGIIPAVISTFVVPKIGSTWARRFFLTGERFGSEVALQMGLVHEVVAEGELDGAISRHVSSIREAGPKAVREAKALIDGLSRQPVDRHRDFTARRIASVRTSSEGQEGLRAFLEKRDPAWKRKDA